MQFPPTWNDKDSPVIASQRGEKFIEAELVASMSWLVRLRWVAGAGVLLITLLIGPLFGLRAPLLPLLSIGGSILVYNLVFMLIEQRLTLISARLESYRRLAVWQVSLDWLAMILLIHFSGGIESPAIFFFIFHIVIASMFFTASTAFGFAFMAIGLLSGLALLEYFSFLPHASIIGFSEFAQYKNPLYVAAVLGFFSSTGLIVAYLVTTISERLRRREAQVLRLTESLQRATARLQALNEGARTINSTLELSQVLNRLVKNTAEVLGAKACSIRLVDKTGQRLEPVAVYGLSQAYLDKGPIELEKNPLARHVLAGKVVNIPDVTQTTVLQYAEWTVQEGISSMLSAPLIGKNVPLGILRAYSDEKDRFTQEDENFLAAIAAQGSIAIENAMAYQAIEELDASKSTFIRMVTHELRSPVSVARSLLRTITAGYVGQVSPQQVDLVERTIRRIDFLQKLIDDLLDLASGKMVDESKLNMEPVALEEVLQRVIKRYEASAREKRITLDCQDMPGDKLTWVMATAEGLDRIFNNLISNAVKYNREDGKVRVILSQDEEEACVAIEDTGIGIPEEAMEHLFEEFYRAPNAKEIEREGTGLGLAIVKDTVTRFGGRVAVQSKPGVGSRFSVSLPMIEKEMPETLEAK